MGHLCDHPEVAAERATVLVNATIMNSSSKSASLEIRTLLYDRDSALVSSSSGPMELSAGASR